MEIVNRIEEVKRAHPCHGGCNRILNTKDVCVCLNEQNMCISCGHKALKNNIKSFLNTINGLEERYSKELVLRRLDG